MTSSRAVAATAAGVRTERDTVLLGRWGRTAGGEEALAVRERRAGASASRTSSRARATTASPAPPVRARRPPGTTSWATTPGTGAVPGAAGGATDPGAAGEASGARDRDGADRARDDGADGRAALAGGGAGGVGDRLGGGVGQLPGAAGGAGRALLGALGGADPGGLRLGGAGRGHRRGLCGVDRRSPAMARGATPGARPAAHPVRAGVARRPTCPLAGRRSAAFGGARPGGRVRPARTTRHDQDGGLVLTLATWSRRTTGPRSA